MTKYLILLAVLVAALQGCHGPWRYSPDGTTAIPLSPVGSNLPPGGLLPSGDQGPIYFDSLYVISSNRPGKTRATYLRFWPTGEVLWRSKEFAVSPEDSSRIVINAHDGEIPDNWLVGPPADHKISIGDSARVGRYTIVGKKIFIEWFGFLVPDFGQSSFVFEGQFTSTGFELTRDRPIIWFGRWEDMPASHEPYKFSIMRFDRYRVGEMKGKPDW